MQEIDDDLERTVISFIPNTAEIGYFGLLEQLRLERRERVKQSILDAQEKWGLNKELVDDLIMRNWPLGER